eukprot:SAG25_NODE_3219_length_1167_cov_1.446629_1_plen_156_part_10
MTCVLAEYERLPPLPLDVFAANGDAFTDSFEYQGVALPSQAPGRGMGLLDAPELKLIGDIDPSDVKQGGVGDCWLLSAISALAEFDGAVRRLFHHTAATPTGGGESESGDSVVVRMPLDDGNAARGVNKYTVTLFDLTTWLPVDVVVDERLAARPD